jgi:hypothetical protein
VRTTNDVEGWHTHLANHAGLSISSKGLNLYILLEVLYEEAIQVDIYTKMLEQGQQLRRQRKTFKELNLKLFGLWNDYSKQKITVKLQFLPPELQYTNYYTKLLHLLY